MEDSTSYIDRPVISNKKIYVKGYQDLQVMKLDKMPMQTCINDSEHINVNKLIELMVKRFGYIMKPQQSGSNPTLAEETKRRTCVSNQRRYVKLEHRTKTLDYIKKENDSTNMEKVAPLIDTYEKRSQKIRQPIRLESEQE